MLGAHYADAVGRCHRRSADSRPYGNDRVLSFCSAALASFVALPLLLRVLSTGAGRCAAAIGCDAFLAGGGHAVGVSTYWYHHAAGAVRLAGLASGAAGPLLLLLRRMVGLGMGRWPWLHWAPLGVLVGLLLWSHGALAGGSGCLEYTLMATWLLATAYALVAAVAAHLLAPAAWHFVAERADLLWLSWLSAVVVLILTICVLASLVAGVWIWLLVVLRLAVVYVVGWYGLRQGPMRCRARWWSQRPPPRPRQRRWEQPP